MSIWAQISQQTISPHVLLTGKLYRNVEKLFIHELEISFVVKICFKTGPSPACIINYAFD